MVPYFRSNGQLRNTLNKARTLCDKWRGSSGSGNIGAGNRLSLDGSALPGDTSPQNHGRLSRWFSIRRGNNHQYDIENADAQRVAQGNKMPQLPEVSEKHPKKIFIQLCTLTKSNDL